MALLDPQARREGGEGGEYSPGPGAQMAPEGPFEAKPLLFHFCLLSLYAFSTSIEGIGLENAAKDKKEKYQKAGAWPQMAPLDLKWPLSYE